MPETPVPPEYVQRVRNVVRAEYERIGIFADSEDGLLRTRRNFTALDDLAPVSDELVDLVNAERMRKIAQQESDKAREQEQRERRTKRYEAIVGFLASIAQYGAAGALGYGVSWILAHWRH